MERKRRVYIAGKLRDDAIPYIEHVRETCFEAQKVAEAGFQIYVPAWDLLHLLVVGDLNFTALFNNSYAWLDQCEAVYVVKNQWRSSKGTKREIAKAKRLGIPVFFELDDLIKWREDKDE